MGSADLPPDLADFERRMQQALGRPDVRLVVDGDDVYFTRNGAELRVTEDGWVITERLADGNIVAAELDGDREDMWAGVLRPGDPDAN